MPSLFSRTIPVAFTLAYPIWVACRYLEEKPAAARRSVFTNSFGNNEYAQDVICTRRCYYYYYLKQNNVVTLLRRWREVFITCYPWLVCQLLGSSRSDAQQPDAPTLFGKFSRRKCLSFRPCSSNSPAPPFFPGTLSRVLVIASNAVHFDLNGNTTVNAVQASPNIVNLRAERKVSVKKKTDEQLLQDIRRIVKKNKVVLFMKGTPEAPQCQYSRRAVEILLDLGCDDFTYIDVLPSERIRELVKQTTGWPTIPQLFIQGEFVGGSDIMNELHASGELRRKLYDDPPFLSKNIENEKRQSATSSLGSTSSSGDTRTRAPI